MGEKEALVIARAIILSIMFRTKVRGPVWEELEEEVNSRQPWGKRDWERLKRERKDAVVTTLVAVLAAMLIAWTLATEQWRAVSFGADVAEAGEVWVLVMDDGVNPESFHFPYDSIWKCQQGRAAYLARRHPAVAKLVTCLTIRQLLSRQMQALERWKAGQ